MKQEPMNMINPRLQKISGCSRSAMVTFAIFAMWAGIGAYPGLAQQPAAQTFPTASAASQSLFEAVQHNDEQAIANILGGSTNLTSSHDEAQDKLERELFVQKYEEMHRLGREGDRSMTLYIGAENWPFPIPLVEKNGAWHFDSDAGLKEVLYRRIGRNELTAIAICNEFVADEKHYGAKPNTASLTDSSPASLVARAARESAGGDPVLFHGYNFRLLPTQGKTTGTFTLIAFPAAYRSSGVMTLIVTEDDIVYEKDLGANTSAVANAMTTFHKDATWHAADE